MRTLIVGCGYVGLPLGLELARQGHEVFGLRRGAASDSALHEAGLIPLAVDITEPGQLETLPTPFDWVVNAVSSTRGGEDDYRRVYLEGTRLLIQRLAACPPKKYIHLSSTSVYGQTDGSLVKEDSPTEPASPTSRILVETERLLRNAAHRDRFPALILRVSGIYGPNRGHLFQQYLRNEARIAGRGERLINMIHRDDVVGAILAALKSGRPGEVYNVTDDEAVTQLNFFRWLSETLGKWMPPFATEAENENRKRGLTQKRVSNRRLKMELGYQFKYPTFRQGYTAEIRRLDDAGLLDLKSETR
ncbi:MAG TPA: SDR family oxidoreductase [Methylomirabilota bacterium]|nr:SDR family oxidoreductase [Methylomirabilota bacterium]